MERPGSVRGVRRTKGVDGVRDPGEAARWTRGAGVGASSTIPNPARTTSSSTSRRPGSTSSTSTSAAGLYPMTLPFTPGSEGAGVVRAVGSEVTRFSVGDRVAWSSVLGSYAQQVRVPEAAAVAVPEGIGLDVAAAVMLQGMTAHYLALDTYPLKEGDRCLIHAGAGGVGLLLIQIAKRCGAEVFTTVGSADEGGVGHGRRRGPRDHLRRHRLRFGGRGHRRPPPARCRVRRRRQGRVRAGAWNCCAAEERWSRSATPLARSTRWRRWRSPAAARST